MSNPLNKEAAANEENRKRFLRDLDEIAGTFGPDWTVGAGSVDWVRRQRDE